VKEDSSPDSRDRFFSQEIELEKFQTISERSHKLEEVKSNSQNSAAKLDGSDQKSCVS
jgi:hypothetical protein